MIYKDEDIFEAAKQLKLRGENPLILVNKDKHSQEFKEYRNAFEFTDEPEALLDFERPIFRLGLTPTKITHAVNFRILIDAMNQSDDLGDLVHRELLRKFPQYTGEFIKNPHNWCSLEALDHVWQTIKNLKNNQNPRMLSDLIKHNIIDKSFFDLQDGLILFTPVNVLFEAAAGVNRNSDENYAMQHISTHQIKSDLKGVKMFESYFIGTYFANFLYDKSVRYTNEMFGNGLLKGLPARKNHYFADVDYRASVMKLEDVLSVDYGYLGLELERTDSKYGTFLINGKESGHKVVAQKKVFKQEMTKAGRLINKKHIQEAPAVFDFFDVKELYEYSESELKEGLKYGQLVVVDQIDVDVLDTSGIRHELEGSHYVLREGEILSAPYTSYKVYYSNEKREIGYIRDKNIFNIAKKDKDLLSKIISASKSFRFSKKRDVLMAHLLEQYLLEKDKDRQRIEMLESLVDEKTAELKMRAEYDDLTGIYNRRGFLDRANSLYAIDSRNRNTSAVILADIDFFKLYNDQYGHVQGDACLKYFASVLKKYGHRESDIVGRYGGEEFIIFLPSTKPMGAEAVVQHIIDDLHENPYEHIRNAPGILTSSFGIAYSNQGHNSMEKLIHCADLALYHQKDNGRDGYSVYEEK